MRSCDKKRWRTARQDKAFEFIDLSASLSNCPSGAGLVPTKSSSSSGSDLPADLMLRHKNLIYGGEVIYKIHSPIFGF